MLFGLIKSNETRALNSLEDPTVSLSDPLAWNEFFYRTSTATGEPVTEASALGVTSIWQAVNVISGTIASLPCQLYKKDAAGVAIKSIADPLYYIIHDRPNDYQSSFAFFKWFVSRLLLNGRATAFINRNKAGRVKKIEPLDPAKLTISQKVSADGSVERIYTYTLQTKRIDYSAFEVIDVVWLPQADALNHYSPIQINANAISLMIAAEKFGAKLFANGGVPPLALKSITPLSPAAASRASIDVSEAIKASQKTKSNILVTPPGHELTAIGLNPEKSQMIELRQFMISETSRIFNIAPAILHDLTHGTYSNVEQQNLSFASQTIHPILELIEQEFNAKLFGDRNNSNYMEFNLQGLLRGDFASRMEGLAAAVNSALRTPNEARALDNLPPLPGGDQLMIQGATVPLVSQPAPADPNADPNNLENDND